MTRLVNGVYVDDANNSTQGKIAPTATALSYASGAIIGGLQMFANAGGADGHAISLRTARLHCTDALTGEVDLVLFRAQPASAAALVDGAVFATALGAADEVYSDKILKFTSYDPMGSGVLSVLDGINDQITLDDGATLYALAVARSAVTLAGASDLTFGLEFEEV